MTENLSHQIGPQENLEPDLTLNKKGDLADILGEDGADKPSMRGFDPHFNDIIDYIIKVTHEIWEEGGIGRLYEYYGTNMRVNISNGGFFNRKEVIESTIQALAAFPDRRLYGDEVIWTGDDETGFYTSHRLTHEGHNWGHTLYGPPTGRKVSYRAIADCAVIENRIVEEWLVRDETTLINQLGFDVRKMARRMAAREAETAAARDIKVPGEPDRLQGQRPPVEIPPFDSKSFDVELYVRNSFHEIWNWRLLNKLKEYFTEEYSAESASGRRLYGLNQYRSYILSLMAPLPDLAVTVDHFCALQEREHRYRTATRWTLVGSHTGPGIYGEPTGQRVRIMGMTHHLIQDGKFIQEWTVFDEFALLKQIYASQHQDP